MAFERNFCYNTSVSNYCAFSSKKVRTLWSKFDQSGHKIHRVKDDEVVGFRLGFAAGETGKSRIPDQHSARATRGGPKITLKKFMVIFCLIIWVICINIVV